MTTKTFAEITAGDRVTNSAQASRLFKVANGLSAQIDNLLNPAIGDQNRTPRRIRIADSMRRRGLRLELVQKVMRRAAMAHEDPNLWSVLMVPANDPTWRYHLDDLRFLKTRKDFEELPTPLLEALAGGPRAETREEKLRRLENGLVGTKIPGFFSTPNELADRLVSEITPGLDAGMKILEPSAGSGALLDALERWGAYPRSVSCGAGLQLRHVVTMDAIEISSTLREVLLAKGYTVRPESDCLTVIDPTYDRILMNPPFERGQDADHTRHAFDHLLKPGGVLAAIVSNGLFFRSDRKSREFKDWLFQKDAKISEPIEEAFTGADALRQTGVTVRIVTLRKKL